MITNPGGQLAPAEILGREELIAYLWKTLAGRCVYMNDLRRIGKTQIMVKMTAEPSENWVCVKRDLGRSHTAEEFARQAFSDSSSVLTGGKKAMRRMVDLLGTASGTEIAGILKLPDGSVAPWKEVLERTFRDINETMESQNQRMVFLWDEVPFLIDNIASRQDSKTAMEVLDVIRSLTQDFDRVRVLLTGSIGLHHILKKLKQDGYSGSPLNRMELVRPGPLSPEAGFELAQKLLVGEEIKVDDLDACASQIATSVGQVAFYIHKLISRLESAAQHTPSTINGTLNDELADLNNDWDLEHYRTRLDDYYEQIPVALAILDAVAIKQSLSFDAVRSAVSAAIKVDDEQIRETVNLLCKDHYLDHDREGTYSFYLSVVARWWRISRDLKHSPIDEAR